MDFDEPQNIAMQFDRLPPNSIEAEMCLIASMMLAGPNSPAFFEMRAAVGRGDFYLADHQILFEIITGLADKNRPIDAVIVREELVKRQLLEEIGGVPYLAQLLGSVPSYAHGTHYASIVKEKAQLRKLIGASNDVLRDCYAPSGAVNQAVEIGHRALAKVSEAIADDQVSKVEKISDLLPRVYDSLSQGGVSTVLTGWADFDDYTGGIGLGEMVIVGARPSMGKSTILRNLAEAIPGSMVPTLYLSLEEPSEKIGRNMLAAHCQIENHLLRRGQLTNAHWSRLLDGVNVLSQFPLFVSEKARRMDDIRSVVNLLVAREGVKVVILDYLGRVRGLPGRSRYEVISNASNAVSDLIKETKVAGIVASQINRGVEGRDDKRPTMSDLRESGEIEQDADGVVLLYREDYYHLDDPNYTPDGIVELIVAKWRDGRRGRAIKLRSNLKFQRFENTHTSVPEEISYGT